jgi:hypothetical protein
MSSNQVAAIATAAGAALAASVAVVTVVVGTELAVNVLTCVAGAASAWVRRRSPPSYELKRLDRAAEAVPAAACMSVGMPYVAAFAATGLVSDAIRCCSKARPA